MYRNMDFLEIPNTYTIHVNASIDFNGTFYAREIAVVRRYVSMLMPSAVRVQF